MPRIQISYQPEVMQARICLREPLEGSQQEFFSALFRAFEEQQVRYCALHTLHGRLYRADFAVHPKDKSKLVAAFCRLHERGYFAVQWLELTSGTQRIFFVSSRDAGFESLTIDVIFDDSPAFGSIHKLIGDRERENNYWVPGPNDWFEYLVADCALDGQWRENEIRHLQLLITRLGRVKAEQQLEHLLGRGQGSRGISALLQSEGAGLPADSTQRLRRRVLLQHPWRRVLARIARWARTCGSMIRPRGAFAVFLGPDGVGKTTLLREVEAGLAQLFPIRSVYRWRPGVFARAPRPACLPHSKPLRSRRGSIFYALFAWMDFVAGYLWQTRWILAQNGLVIFDRYYHDILVDPVRYRYAGPKWLLKLLAKLIPPRDILFLVLDADEHTILRRKQQLPPEEIRRQRIAYSNFAGKADAAAMIETNRPIEECRRQALRQCFAYLSRQLAKQHGLVFRNGGTLPSPAEVSEEASEGIAGFQQGSAEEQGSAADAGMYGKKASIQRFSAAPESGHMASELNCWSRGDQDFACSVRKKDWEK